MGAPEARHRKSKVLLVGIVATFLATGMGALFSSRSRSPSVVEAVRDAQTDRPPRGPERGDTAPKPDDASAETIPESPFLGAVDCSGFVPDAGAECPSARDALGDLVGSANEFTPAPAPCAASRALMSMTSVNKAHDAVLAVAHTDVAGWTLNERIVAQNAALRLGICASFRADQTEVHDKVIELRHQAMDLVHQLAPTPSELATLGSAPNPEIARWLGDPASWRDLQPPVAVSFHEQGYGFTKSIRTLVVGGDVLANLGQLVAVDRDWVPHVTPIIGSLEVRRPLRSVDATLCAASLDVDRLRCGAPAGLRPFGEGDAGVDPSAPVLFRSDRILSPCQSCHVHLGWPRSTEITTGSRAASVAQRRQALLQKVAALIAAARRP
jgi:hypothetical protein